MTDEVSMIQRLRSAQGHLEAVMRMADEGSCCADLLHQLSAVQGALDRVRRELVEAHLRQCLPEALAQDRLDDAVEEVVTVVFGGPPQRRVAE